MGRQSTFTEQGGQEICDHISNGGSLRSYVEQEGKPAFNTVYKWLGEHEAFAEAYARAREVQAHADADKINRLQEQLEAGMIAPDVARVMADCLKWTAARRAPRVYGDKVQLSGDADGAPIAVTWGQTD